ncbi:MAG: hypothetical protein HFI75_05825 [Lachnospiraceae bacterium]|nr:hypothetical protein [Lachnospiraceae bacterium]
MGLKWAIVAIEALLGIIGIVSSHGVGHGIFNGGVAWTYPECGRKASKYYGILQLIMLVVTGLLFLIFKPSKLLTVVSAVVGSTISLFISLFVLHRLVKREIVKDELDRKEQIKKEQTTFR